jgi:hypothetical protein
MDSRKRRKAQYSNTFVSVVFGVGISLVLTFLLFTVAIIFLQAFEQWHK